MIFYFRFHVFLFYFFNLYLIELNPDSLWCKLEKFDLYAVFTYFLCFWPINNLWKIPNHSTFSQKFFLLLSTSFGFENRHIIYFVLSRFQRPRVEQIKAVILYILFCPGSSGHLLSRLKLSYCAFCFVHVSATTCWSN